MLFAIGARIIGAAALQWPTRLDGYSSTYPFPLEGGGAPSGETSFSWSASAAATFLPVQTTSFSWSASATAYFEPAEPPEIPEYLVGSISRHEAPYDVAFPATITPLETMLGAAVAGSTALPSLVTPSGIDAGYMPTPWDFWYNRIWVIPGELTPLNPRRNTDIPFSIMNAYEHSNTLNTIGTSGATGLTLDISASEVFGSLEIHPVNLQIGATAPNEIDATFTFTFTDGEGELHFVATVSDFVVMFPDDPVVETLSWKTDIMVGFDGTEQRVALRTAPRRNVEFSFIIDQAERRTQYRRWHRSIGNRLVVPFYWYAARLTADASSGATRIYFDPDTTDLRDGDYLIIANPMTYEGQLVTATTIEVDGATLNSPLTADAAEGDFVAPGFDCRMIDRTGLAMKHVTGAVTYKVETLTPRVPFARPGSAASITTFDGYDVLDVEPVAPGDSDEEFNVNYEIFDGETGVTDIDQAWLHPSVSGVRQFRVARETEGGIMDYWRDFLDARLGRQGVFLMPTWLEDLELESMPDGSNQLVLADDEYVAELFPYETYKRLAIFSDAGVAYRAVSSAVANGDGTATLFLDSPYGATADEQAVYRVSFLNLVRLGEDSVKFTHQQDRSYLELKFMTVDG